MATELPQSMRASQWTSTVGGLEKNLKVNNNASLPKSATSLGKGQTLVKIYYSALNPVDFKVPELPVVGAFAIKKPASPCMDFSGEVIETTRDDLKRGQLVFGKLEPPQFGALAEYAIVGREGAVPIPEGVNLEDAGCVGVAGLTAYQCIAPNVKKGDKVFINGATGGTGSFGVQIAKALGCYVVATCSGPNVELCNSLGADEVIDYRSQDVVQTLKRKGTQFDLCVDFSGANPDIYWQCHHYLKEGRKYVNVGASPSLGAVIGILKIFLWPGFLGGGQRKYQFLSCATSAKDFSQIGQLISDGKVKPVIDSRYDLEDVSKAFEKLKAGGIKGKLVVKVSKENS